MTMTPRPPIDYYLGLRYPFYAIADEEVGYVIVFPDLPGCMTQVETIDEIPRMAEEARRLWIESACEDGEEVPLPSYMRHVVDLSLRVPRPLFVRLVEAAAAANTHLLTVRRPAPLPGTSVRRATVNRSLRVSV
jgi:antitoxin HicB